MLLIRYYLFKKNKYQNYISFSCKNSSLWSGFYIGEYQVIPSSNTIGVHRPEDRNYY